LEEGRLVASRNPLVQVASAYMKGLAGGPEHVRNVTSREANRLLNRHERGLRLLATIGNIAPLIGLLGTVWGMVQAFANIAVLGDAVRPSDLADGIWTGLLTTVAGLVVAIPAIAMTRFYEARIDHLAHDLNEVVSHLDEWTREGGEGDSVAGGKVNQ
jgi:biopolymer transport protein ExbB